MIRWENDKKIFEAEYPAIVPFLMEEYRGHTDFEVYSGVRRVVTAFEKEYRGRFFSDAALEAIGSVLDPYITAHGYRRETRGGKIWYRSFEMRGASRVDPALFRADSFFLNKAFLLSHPTLKNATTFHPMELAEKGLPAFVTVAEDTIVSVAAVNENFDSEAMAEITVETAVAHRGKAYATANAAALTDHLLKNGRSVAYCCRKNNTKSTKIARRLGMEEVGRFFAVTAYRYGD